MKKDYRLKKNEEFSRIINKRKHISNASFTLYYDKKLKDIARIGISVSKKLGNAVMRNKIKRQVRMMCLKLIDFNKCEFDYVIIVKKAYLDKNYKDNILYLEKLIKKDII